MSAMIGSARHDEKNGYTGGAKGDSLQISTPDYKGEVSMQKFYVHKKGWNVIRALDTNTAIKIANKMVTACNNWNLGYSQSDRYGVIKYGINSNVPTNCDCSSLVRACVKEASGKDPGDFTTANAAQILERTGLFQPVIPYTASTMLKAGDILCTKTKGHIVIVTEGDIWESSSDTLINATVPVNGNPYKEPTKAVRFNTKGNDARWLQYELNRRGAKLIVDGIIGEKSINKLIEFQKKAFPNDPSEWDGICGEKTKKALKSL